MSPTAEPASTTGGKAERALAAAAEAGIHCIALPTPFNVGRVNTWLIEDEPLTLVDTGPNSGSALDELEGALRARGHAVEDLGLIVVTHQHMDHTGLLDILARRSGAEVAGTEQLADYVERYDAEIALDDRFMSRLLRSHGIPPDVATAVGSVARAFRGWGAAAKVTRRLREGDRVELADRSLEVLARPGHSPTDTAFLDRERSMMIGGDHLLAHISSNALVSRPPGASPDCPRPASLATYIDSMRATAELDVGLTLSGHGDPITDHGALIASRMRLHERRKSSIHELIARAPLTAHEIAHALWGNVAVTQAYLTLSEVIGHIDLLLGEGSAREAQQDGTIRFEAA